MLHGQLVMTHQMGIDVSDNGTGVFKLESVSKGTLFGMTPNCSTNRRSPDKAWNAELTNTTQPDGSCHLGMVLHFTGMPMLGKQLAFMTESWFDMTLTEAGDTFTFNINKGPRPDSPPPPIVTEQLTIEITAPSIIETKGGEFPKRIGVGAETVTLPFPVVGTVTGSVTGSFRRTTKTQTPPGQEEPDSTWDTVLEVLGSLMVALLGLLSFGILLFLLYPIPVFGPWIRGIPGLGRWFERLRGGLKSPTPTPPKAPTPTSGIKSATPEAPVPKAPAPPKEPATEPAAPQSPTPISTGPKQPASKAPAPDAVAPQSPSPVSTVPKQPASKAPTPTSATPDAPVPKAPAPSKEPAPEPATPLKPIPSYTNPSSFHGMNPSEVKTHLPSGWEKFKDAKNGGSIFKPVDSRSNSDSIRIMPNGTPGSSLPDHRGPYMKISVNGERWHVPLEGNPHPPRRESPPP